MARIRQSFGEEIVFNRLSSMKIPITKAELIDKYGEEPIVVDWHRENMILLRDIFRVNTIQIFYSKFELAMELNKIYTRFRRGLF